MKLFINVTLYVLTALMILQNHLFIAVLLAGWFTFRCGALWLLPLAFLIDGYFGAFAQVPVISLVAIVWYVASEWLRPRLLVQHESYAKTS